MNIKERRKELGLTMKEVAAFVDVSEATVSRWESGNIANMKRNRIALLAEILHVSPFDIMGIEDELSKEKTATSGSLKTEKDILIDKVKQMSDEQVHAVLLILDSQHK